MIELRDYQKQAVDDLYLKFQSMLCSSKNEICIFQAPTGSGKTVVVASLLKKLITENHNDVFSFIWIAPRKLHEQSKRKLENFYHDQILKCSNFDDLENNKIDKNEILFFNWESINKTNNIYIIDNEDNKNLSTVIQNTNDVNHKLILIIDESHHAASAKKSLEIIYDLAPDVTLEVSATPHLNDIDEKCNVRLNDVKNEGMIKNEIIINPKFSKFKVGKKSSDEIIIQEALKQRKFLKSKFKKLKSKINPLILIQIPDKRSLMEDKLKTVINILEKNGITKKNEKLAIWLSDEKTENLSSIVEPDNDVEVLIFKQAISLGWDCPRASILVIFRDYSKFEFTIQTIGRIMRMPELKHYPKNPELNKGYIFTNLETINLTQEYVKGYTTQYNSCRQRNYKPIKLKSIYIKRQRERTRLSGDFIKIFNKKTIIAPIMKNINLKPTKIIKPLVSDGRISDIDKKGMIKIRKKLYVSSTDKQIYYKFMDFINSACRPYALHDSSDRLKSALYQFLKTKYNIEKYSANAQSIIIGNENYQLFWNAINTAKEQYSAKIIRDISKKKNIDVTLNWEVPKVMSFSGGKKMDNSKSIVSPFYFDILSKPEKKFIAKLNKSSKITWWYKNGESEKKYFAVPYVDKNGYKRGFYVDFIIKFSDGKIGIFDIKKDITAEIAGPKHDGLHKYIKNNKNKKLFGGILVEKNNIWRYHDKRKYHFDRNNLSDWTILEL